LCCGGCRPLGSHLLTSARSLNHLVQMKMLSLDEMGYKANKKASYRHSRERLEARGKGVLCKVQSTTLPAVLA